MSESRLYRPRTDQPGLDPDPLWYKTAVIYEVHVRALCDSNADGIGDFPGLTSKLDYFQDLGVTALWLLPFYPSPLRDGGYDIADYTNINPAYGTMEDFRRFLEAAHQRGLRVITELVLNHTSVEHSWFQRARRAPPDSPERSFYIWSDTPQRYASVRIIFRDFEASNWAWDPAAGAYYFHRFYSHQPDLNYDNPAVHEAVLEVLDFWFGLGVDGLRLDAVPYLYKREGTSCENLPETHQFLKKLRSYVDAKYQGRMILAEANQWPEDAAAYFGAGDECHMNFHFPLMPRLFMALEMEDSFPIIDILRQTPAIAPTCQWANFLRNHDELTLEMVTDEERDYMYRTYSQDAVARLNLGIRRRLAPLLRSRDKIELMNALLFSLPGTPVLYYGDEIGMGDNVYLGDRDGVRTPMQWSSDRNAGFSRANPQRLYLPIIIDPEYHFEAVNVEAQQGNAASLLWWMKRLIAMNKEHPAFGQGNIEFIRHDNARVLAFARGVSDENVLVVANLSRYPQHTELELQKFAGSTPVEMFGRSAFPAITSHSYPVALGPHSFYWFLLEASAGGTAVRTTPHMTAKTWPDILQDSERLAEILATYAQGRRWFRSKSRTVRSQRIVEVIELSCRQAGQALFTLLELDYTEGERETYVIPLMFVSGDSAVQLEQSVAHAVIAKLQLFGSPPVDGVLYDGLGTGEAAVGLLDALTQGSDRPGELGRMTFSTFAPLKPEQSAELVPRPMKVEQTNTTVPFDERWLLKTFRQLEPGVNSEIEVGRFLTQQGRPGLLPKVLGSVHYNHPELAPAAMAILQEFVPNQGMAWDLMVKHLEALFERVLSSGGDAPLAPSEHLLELDPGAVPESLKELSGVGLRHAATLGLRTAEVHGVLARGVTPTLAPERFTHMHQRSLFQSARARLVRTIERLSRRLPSIPEGLRADVLRLIEAQASIEAALRRVTSRDILAIRIRCHGDLHLGQVLFTGDDFVIIDFEGEPALPPSERRYKRCALRDVAGMLRSFAYAADMTLRIGHQRPQDVAKLLPWASAWRTWVSAAFLGEYVKHVGPTGLLPPKPADRQILLDFYVLEKCIYEVGYELNNRPDWLGIPVRGLLEMLGEAG